MRTFRKIAVDTGMGMQHCDNVETAKIVFNLVDPSVVFLDHDLGGEIYVDSDNDNTGYQFAKWLVENDKKIDQRTIVIHSMNPVGAENIQNILNSANIIPFTYFFSDQHVLYSNGIIKQTTP